MAASPRHESIARLDQLAALPVSADATTSKVLVDNPLLRVVYFSFDAGQQLTEHASPRAVVVTLLDGAIRFTVDGREHRMTPGDAIYLAPGAPHALVADQPSHLSLVMVDAAGAAEGRPAEVDA